MHSPITADTDVEPCVLASAQVLLVEPCDMVRQVLTLALRGWGTAVCAVKSDSEAISHLKLRSALPRAPALLPSFSMPCSNSTSSCLHGRQHQTPYTTCMQAFTHGCRLGHGCTQVSRCAGKQSRCSREHVLGTGRFSCGTGHGLP